MPWEWLRFFCGVWTEGEEPWIEPGVWDGLAEDFDLDEKVYLGVDRGSRDEEPAIVLAAKREDRIYVKARVFPTGTDFEDLEDAIRALKPITASYDPNQFESVAERLRKEGYQMRQFPLTAERMSKASITLWDLIEKGTIRPRRRSRPSGSRHGRHREGGRQGLEDPARPSFSSAGLRPHGAPDGLSSRRPRRRAVS